MMITNSAAWAALDTHRQSTGKTHLRELFANDPKRVESLSLSFEGMLYDFSKQRLTSEILGLLVNLAKEAGLAASIERMFAGEQINSTEGRSVLHVALRRSAGPFPSRQFDVMPDIISTKQRRASSCCTRA